MGGFIRTLWSKATASGGGIRITDIQSCCCYWEGPPDRLHLSLLRRILRCMSIDLHWRCLRRYVQSLPKRARHNGTVHDSICRTFMGTIHWWFHQHVPPRLAVDALSGLYSWFPRLRTGLHIRERDLCSSHTSAQSVETTTRVWGNWAIHAKQEEIETTLRELVEKNLARPLTHALHRADRPGVVDLYGLHLRLALSVSIPSSSKKSRASIKVLLACHSWA